MTCQSTNSCFSLAAIVTSECMLKRVFSYSAEFLQRSFSEVAASVIQRVDCDYIDILTSLKSNQSRTFGMCIHHAWKFNGIRAASISFNRATGKFSSPSRSWFIERHGDMKKLLHQFASLLQFTPTSLSLHPPVSSQSDYIFTSCHRINKPSD